ncbi:hypothetical protein, partial [Bradyrhizobium cenepequi]|uniref:hypothetical protein n=1 Tax=Bradyrhizobium cenepequi TaxID=2821403 RepID=UPI001CE38FD2
PVDERLGTDDGKNLKDRRKAAVQLNEEPAIIVRKPDAAPEPAPQNNQLMPKRRFSASSLIFDLNGAANAVSTKHRSPIIPPA